MLRRCPICKAWHEELLNHLLTEHGLSPRDATKVYDEHK